MEFLPRPAQDVGGVTYLRRTCKLIIRSRRRIASNEHINPQINHRMDNHYIIIADRAHLRVFSERSELGQSTPGLTEVHTKDFPEGRTSYTDSDTDMAGRFNSSKHQGNAPGAPTARSGMSIDERLPMQREAERRQNENISQAIDAFLAGQPSATWDFAAGPSSHNAILEKLSPQSRSRLRNSISKDLVNQPLSGLLGHFRRAAA